MKSPAILAVVALAVPACGVSAVPAQVSEITCVGDTFDNHPYFYHVVDLAGEKHAFAILGNGESEATLRAESPGAEQGRVTVLWGNPERQTAQFFAEEGRAFMVRDGNTTPLECGGVRYQD